MVRQCMRQEITLDSSEVVLSFCSDLVNGLVALMNSNVSSPVNLVSKCFVSNFLLNVD